MTEIEKAIAYWEQFKQEAIDMIAKGLDVHCELAKQIPMCEIVLAALREKQERQKGCEYCTDLSRYKGFGYAEYFHQTAPDEAYEISIEVKFCPNCGRKLEDEQDG